MRVISIDPAPAKGLSVFDGRDRHVPIDAAFEYVSSVASGPPCLVCWDAPLTGPSAGALSGKKARAGDFTKRRIESFFTTSRTGFCTPVGISVQGYAGCQHWTISRSLLGLPRVGPWDQSAEDLPFELITDDARPQGTQRLIVEIHPAVALWLWCRERWPPALEWTYKKNSGVRVQVWDCLRERLCRFGDQAVKAALANPPTTDDELDARIGFLLGTLWMSNNDEVALLGDLESGTFLLPKVAGLSDAFDEFEVQ